MANIRMVLSMAVVLSACLALGAGRAPSSSTAPASQPSTGPATMPAGTGAVSGKIVGEDGKPIEGAEVSVYLLGADRQIQTLAKTKSGKDGAFTITSVGAGEGRRVWASFQIPRGPTLMGEVRDLKIEAGKTLDVGAIKIAPATM
jgi:hypothetical protein